MDSRAEDLAVLEELAANGDKPEICRPFRAWIYGATHDLGEICRRLEKFGWSIDSFLVDATGEMDWQAELIITRVQAADQQTVFSMSDEIETAIVGTSARYDGWETSTETGSSAQTH